MKEIMLKKHTLKKTLYVLCGITLLIWALSVMCNCDLTEGQFYQRIDKLKKDSQPIISWIDKFHAKHGKYPTELPENYQSILDNASPRGTYRLNDVIDYRIIYGNYTEDDFELTWRGKENRWLLDR